MNLRKLIILFGILHYSSTYSCQDHLLKPALNTFLGVACLSMSIGLYKVNNYIIKRYEQESQMQITNPTLAPCYGKALARQARNVMSSLIAANGFLWLSTAYQEITTPCS